MDTRTLIAFGMLLAVLTVALIKGSLDGAAAKEVLQNIASGLIGGAVGFRVAQSQSKPPSTGQTPPKGTPTLPIALLLVGAALLLSGCATSEPYAGPVGPPTMTGDEWFWPHGLDGRWVRETVLHVNNSTPEQLDAVLDCDPAPRHARKWQGSRFTLHVPPMTTQHVLIDPHDHVCSLFPLVSDDDL